MWLIALILLPLTFGNPCGNGWRGFNGNCYKHFYNPNKRFQQHEAEKECNGHGGHLTTVTSAQELNFIGAMGQLPCAGNEQCSYRDGGDNLVRMSGEYGWSDLPVIGLTRVGQNSWTSQCHNNKPIYTRWCEGEPNNYQGKENCIIIVTDAVKDDWYSKPATTVPCMHDALCDGSYHAKGGYSRYVCVRSPVVCKDRNAENVNGQCVCKKDFIDITETDVPERKRFKKGERCISKDPCRDVSDLSVNFIVDSSESIGASNWDSLVEFLRSGADYLPSKTTVSFVKYSTDVTFSKTLASGWTKKEFRDFVPTEYENGGTNTPEALDEAAKMFRKDDSKNKVAVLVTDGLPFSEKYNQAEILLITRQSAKNLRAGDVTFVALGYGPKLDGREIRKWLEDPEEDYFDFDRQACDLKTIHMNILMRKICNRYVKY